MDHQEQSAGEDQNRVTATFTPTGDAWRRREAIFLGKVDCESFLHWLELVSMAGGCLLLDTPEPNLSAGMRILLGTFSQTWICRYQRRGHVFQRRYKAIPVAGERAEVYFKSPQEA